MRISDWSSDVCSSDLAAASQLLGTAPHHSEDKPLAPPQVSPVKIAVVGTGYVGISNAILLAQHNEVVALDIDARTVEHLNAKQSPIADPELEDYLSNPPPKPPAPTHRAPPLSGRGFPLLPPPHPTIQ